MAISKKGSGDGVRPIVDFSPALRQVNEKISILDKPADLFAVPPNFSSYDSVTANFTWEEGRREIDWFDGGLLNAADNAVDR